MFVLELGLDAVGVVESDGSSYGSVLACSHGDGDVGGVGVYVPAVEVLVFGL